MPPYFVAKHVFVCHLHDLTVLLDLHNDRYAGLSDSASSSLSSLISGWREPTAATSWQEDHQPDPDDPHGLALAYDLESKGLLTKNSEHGKPATPVRELSLLQALATSDSWDRPSLHFKSLLKFIRAIVTAKVLLRLCSFQTVVTRVQRRQGRRPTGQCSKEEISALAETFDSLRPFFFTSLDECLFHSLALLEFLWSYGIAAQWVFAVRGAPFASHCWVEWNSFVLNDAPEHARRFKPILIA
jgi:transglutaminase superfamily protein